MEVFLVDDMRGFAVVRATMRENENFSPDLAIEFLAAYFDISRHDLANKIQELVSRRELREMTDARSDETN